MSRLLGVGAFLVSVAAMSLLAQTPVAEPGASSPPEIRRHLTAVSPGGVDDFGITQIQRLSEKDDLTIALIRTVTGDELVAKHEWNYETQVAYTEIRDIRSNEFLRVTSKYTYATKTRTATLEQVSKSPQTMTPDVPFEITGPGTSRLSGIESHWRDPATAREWRSRVRQMISPMFLEELEIVDSSGLFSEPALPALHETLMQYVLYRTSCDSMANLHVDPAVPNCDFDKSFGYPCSEVQEKRVSAAKAARTPQRY